MLTMLTDTGGQVGHGVLLAIERHQSDGYYSAAEDGVYGALTNKQVLHSELSVKPFFKNIKISK